MLVLSRQRDETVMIGDDIEICIVDIRGDKVRLGINAPKNIPVHRKEVYDAIKRENEAALRLPQEELPPPKDTAPFGHSIEQYHTRWHSRYQPPNYTISYSRGI